MNLFFFFLVTRSLNGPARVHGATYLPWVGAITQHPAWAPCMLVPWLSSHPPELSSWVQAVMFFEVPLLKKPLLLPAWLYSQHRVSALQLCKLNRHASILQKS